MFTFFFCVRRHLLISDVLLSKGAKGSSFHMHRKESILLRCVFCALYLNYKYSRNFLSD